MIDSFKDRFLDYKRMNDGCSVRTIQAYGDILQRFGAWLNGEDPRECDDQQLLLFTGMYLNKTFKLHARSRIPYISCIREFYKWLHRLGHISGKNPAESLPYPKSGKPLPRVIELSNAERLVSAPDLATFEGIRDAALFAVLIGCGLRLAGLVALNRSSLVPFTVDGQPRLSVRTFEKGEKERLVPLPREAELLLRVYMEHEDHADIDSALANGDRPLFVSTNNRRIPAHEFIGERRRLSARGVQGIVIRHGLKAGVPKDQLHPHALRHRFGTELTESDVPENQTGELMGHSSADSTRIYTHLAMKKKTQTIDRANPLAKIRTPASELLKRMGQV
ncbi:MAG: tyrosine-type recombinase/integrase [Proteobacteria bacterium]|nr:tyrosine-type recombinase/integrase [Pseudomonadota bacterium]